MSSLTTTLATAFGLYLLLALFMFGCQRSFLYFPDKSEPDIADAGVPVDAGERPLGRDDRVVVQFSGEQGPSGRAGPGDDVHSISAPVARVLPAGLGLAFSNLDPSSVHAVRQLVVLARKAHAPAPAPTSIDPDAVKHAAIANVDPQEHVETREQQGLRPGGFGLLMVRGLVDELIFNETHNARDRVVTCSRTYTDADRAIKIDRPGKDLLADMFALWRGFPRDGCFIDGTFTAEDLTICG